MNSLEIRYFAILREFAGRETEIFAPTTEKTYGDLYLTLSKRYDFPLPIDSVQVAVNDAFSEMKNTLELGARIVFIPPVAGG